MKKFIVTYHAPNEVLAQMQKATPEQRENEMQEWMAWKDRAGDKLVDFGNPLVGGQRLLKDGGSVDSGRELIGYSIIQAEDINDAQAVLSSHPHLTTYESCSVEVHESLPM